MFLTKHIVCLQQQGRLRLFSASFFCYLPSLAIQMAIIISTLTTVVLTEFYFKPSGCEDVKRSSGICIRKAGKLFVFLSNSSREKIL